MHCSSMVQAGLKESVLSTLAHKEAFFMLNLYNNKTNQYNFIIVFKPHVSFYWQAYFGDTALKCCIF